MALGGGGNREKRMKRNKNSRKGLKEKPDTLTAGRRHRGEGTGRWGEKWGGGAD